MKEITYSILAGILLIGLILIKSLLPIFPEHFTVFSKFFGISPLLVNTILSSGIIFLLFCFGIQLTTRFFFSTNKTPPKIFDEPEVETISTAYISLKWRCIKVNKMFCELLGYDARELLKMDFQRLIHPDDFKNDWVSIRQICEGEQQAHQSQQRYLDKNGDLIYLSVTISLKHAKDGKPLYFVCQFQKPHTLTSVIPAYNPKTFSTTA